MEYFKASQAKLAHLFSTRPIASGYTSARTGAPLAEASPRNWHKSTTASRLRGASSRSCLRLQIRTRRDLKAITAPCSTDLPCTALPVHLCVYCCRVECPAPVCVSSSLEYIPRVSSAVHLLPRVYPLPSSALDEPANSPLLHAGLG